MRRTMIVLMVGLAALVLAVGGFAATQSKTKAVLTPVTVAVEGFHCQACPDELQKDLAKLNGVSEVKATLSPAQVTAKLDEKTITASEFAAAIANHKRAMDATKTYGAKLVVYIDAPMCAKEVKMCAACPPEITRVVKAVKGVSGVTLDTTGKVASITFAQGAKVTTADLAAALKKSSFKFTAQFAVVTGAATTPEKAADGSHDGCGGCR